LNPKPTSAPRTIRALVIEDDEDSGLALAQFLRAQGLEAIIATTKAGAMEAIAVSRFDLALLDVQLPDGNGTELMPQLLEQQTDVVMVSGLACMDDAIAALRRGALDFLQKPIDMGRLTAILTNLRGRMALRSEVRELREHLRGLGHFGGIVGASEPMQRVYECIERVAPTNETVMIIGPSGTGKEVAASTIQRLSRRRDQPFITVNCGAISPTLIESELFGHEKGSFTGADRRRKGLFEQADGGTLFLDEVTEMPIELQVRLLRVLETGRITRVGGQEETKVDVRVVAATNRNPEEAVAAGKLRHDLLYRLLVFPIHLPALKDRKGDIALLAQHFLDELRKEYDQERHLSAGAIRRLEAHDWPGNVRELYNTLRRAYIMSTDEIAASDLLLQGSTTADATAIAVPTAPVTAQPKTRTASPENPAAPGSDLPIHAGMTIAAAERLLIEATLEQVGGNKKDAAQALGISLKTLYTRLQVYSATGEA
jgi:DNA-binding NtrC family response regulator